MKFQGAPSGAGWEEIQYALGITYIELSLIVNFGQSDFDTTAAALALR